MALLLKQKNNASGSLAGDITAGATSLSVKAGEGNEFPIITGSQYFYITLQKGSGAWEIVKVTAVSGDDFTIVRNIDSSTGSAQAFSTDDIVSLRPIAQIINDIITEINSYENKLDAPAGTKMYFYQDTAPTGWTIEGGITDKLLAIKGGSDAYNVSGGTTAGIWTQPNHTHNMKNHTHPTVDHVLSNAEMPAHRHGMLSGYGYHSSGSGFAVLGGSPYSGGWNSNPCNYAGGDAGHNHGNTQAPSDNTSDGGATAITYRPAAAVGIIASRNA